MSRSFPIAAAALAMLAVYYPLSAQQSGEDMPFGETVSEVIDGGNLAFAALSKQVAMATRHPTAKRRSPARSVYYRGCSEVEAAGMAPLYRGEPGYREGMDGDGDGIACEDYGPRR